jgi:hypothetical protein
LVTKELASKDLPRKDLATKDLATTNHDILQEPAFNRIARELAA